MSFLDYIPKFILEPFAADQQTRANNVIHCTGALSANIHNLLHDNKYTPTEAQTLAIQLQQIINSSIKLRANIGVNGIEELFILKGKEYGSSEYLDLTMDKHGEVKVVARARSNDITNIC